MQYAVLGLSKNWPAILYSYRLRYKRPNLAEANGRVAIALPYPEEKSVQTIDITLAAVADRSCADPCEQGRGRVSVHGAGDLIRTVTNGSGKNLDVRERGLRTTIKRRRSYERNAHGGPRLTTRS